MSDNQKNGMIRISFHKYTDKDFDSFCFINFDKNKLDKFENYYIIKYQPKYNKFLNKESSKLISYSEFYYKEYDYKKTPRLPFKEAKNEIIKNKLYEIKYNDIIYLNKKDLKKINNYLSKVYLKKQSI